MTKVVLFGAGGQLGRDIIRHLSKKNHTLITFTHEELDITHFDKVKEVIISTRPDVVFNCTAWNRVDDAELPQNHRIVFKINSFAPAIMAQAASKVDSVFVNISTDYVFDGRKGSPYTEDDPVNPLSVYGLSKLLGELLVKKHAKRYVIVRSGGLYGIGGSCFSGRTYRNFVERVIESAIAGKKMRIVKDVFSAPTYTLDLARKICELVEERFEGLIHIMQKGAVSWFEFSKKVCELMDLDSSHIEPVSYDELKPLAERPRFSVLYNSKLERMKKNDMMDVYEALQAYIEERKRYSKT